MRGRCGTLGTIQTNAGSLRRRLLGQEPHEVTGCVGVDAQWGGDDVGCGVRPVLVVILRPVQHGVSHGGLGVDHFPCGGNREACV